MTDDEPRYSEYFVEERLRIEREGHQRELDELKAEFETRLGRLQQKWGAAPPGERPRAIHPDDLTEIDGTTWREIRRDFYSGRVAVSTDAPRGAWRRPVRKITQKVVSGLSRQEWAAVSRDFKRGLVEIVPDP